MRLRYACRITFTVLLVVLACGEPMSMAPDDRGSAFAKGGKGGNGSAAGEDPTVSGVEPDSTVQGQTLDIIVSGDGFEPGSTVDWLLDGVETEGVTTNATTFLSNRKLMANISVSPGATADFYDVRVTTPPGRRGIGSELLQVTEDVPIEVTLRDAPGDEVTSDGGGTYRTTECGDARFNLGDAIVRTRTHPTGKGKTKVACDDDRAFVIAGFPESSPGGPVRLSRFLAIENVKSLPIGVPTETTAGFTVEGCPVNLKFNPAFGGSTILVTRISHDTWSVATRPAPDNTAVCLDSDGNPKFTLAIDFGGTVFQPPP